MTSSLRRFHGCSRLQPGRSSVLPCFRGSVIKAVAIRQSDSRSTIKISFALPYRCDFGQSLCIVGSAHPLGSWDVRRGLQMQWTDGDIWTVDMELQLSTDATGLEYKYVVRNTDGGIAAWKPGGNFCLQLASYLQQRQELLELIQVQDAWDGLSRINITWGTLGPDPGQDSARQDAPKQLLPALKMNPEHQQVESSTGTSLISMLTSEADTALADLDKTITESLRLLEHLKDPTHADAVMADQRVAAAARVAMEASRALKAAERSPESTLAATSEQHHSNQ